MQENQQRLNSKSSKNNKVVKKLSQAQYIASGFFIIILLGTGLLCLPIASASGEFTNPFDAMFTAVSASCVTGLVVLDTGTHWSVFGQIVILFLIQIGGLGFITIGVFFSIYARRKITLNTRARLMESVNALQTGGLLRLTKKIVKGTILIEGICALILMIRFIPKYGMLKGIYFGIFHSISAFCNAGFDLMGCITPYCSFVDYASDPLVVLTLCFLILAGGMGFLVWDDLEKNIKNLKKCSLNTKLVILTNFILIVGGVVLFVIFENDATMAGMNSLDRFLAALFDAISPRTAGFNTTDVAALTPASQLLTWILMFIGGGSGSTAGGIKVTTFAVLVIYVYSGLRQSAEIEIFDRRFEADIIRKANMVLMMNLTCAFIGAIIILSMQPELGVGNVIFETVSAISTVGITTGITRDLCTISRIVIMILMYFGRIGSLTFAFSLFKKKDTKILKSPIEQVLVG